jgi:hypothetical protein
MKKVMICNLEHVLLYKLIVYRDDHIAEVFTSKFKMHIRLLESYFFS